MLPQITVRRFRSADIEQLLEIERTSFGREAYDRNLFADLFHKCGDSFLVAVMDGNICGYMVTCMRGRRAADCAELVSIAVSPAVRGKGVASTLMRNTVRRLRLRGVARFSLVVRTSNETALRLYERHGFRKVRRVPRYYENGEDGVLMNKEL